MKKTKAPGFVRHFEGKARLDELLAAAGSPASTEEALAAFQEGLAQGDDPSDVIPTLFEEEPRFPDPEIARALYQNLLGLYDLVAAKKPFKLEGPAAKEKRPPKEKRPEPSRPAPYGDEDPDDGFVEAAWRYLADLPPKELRRLQDRFENTQDSLLSFLDDSGLSDPGYAAARYALFELHAMIELGGRAPLRSLKERELEGAAKTAAPAALSSYLDEALFEATQAEDPAELLPEGELPKTKAVAERALAALWAAKG